MALRIRVAVFCSYEAFGATASFTGTSATPTLGSIFPVALSLLFGNEENMVPPNAVEADARSKVVRDLFVFLIFLSTYQNDN